MIKCACGRVYTAVTWQDLHKIGNMEMPWGEILELRNCDCNSTLTITLDPGDYESWMASSGIVTHVKGA